MHIVSWNINGLKGHWEHFQRAISMLQPDIFCLQEIRTKVELGQFDVPGYNGIFNPAELSQYYGTAVYLRNGIQPINVELASLTEQNEGRIIMVELPDCFVVNSYWPFSAYSPDGKWLRHRLAWNKRFKEYVHRLQKRKLVIICGDMNLVSTVLDAWDGVAIRKSGCFYPEEHADFEALLTDEHLVDSFRAMHPDECRFTEWAHSKDDAYRKENKGFRINYFLVSDALMGQVTQSDMLSDVMGSEQCPIELKICR